METFYLQLGELNFRIVQIIFKDLVKYILELCEGNLQNLVNYFRIAQSFS